jgi:hypothetical protein
MLRHSPRNLPNFSFPITAQRRDDFSVVTSIPHDATNGWELIGPSYASISLNGTSCASAKDGTYDEIFVLYQCDEPSPALAWTRARSLTGAPELATRPTVASPLAAR